MRPSAGWLSGRTSSGDWPPGNAVSDGRIGNWHQRSAGAGATVTAGSHLTVKRLTPVMERQLMLACRKNRSLSTAAQALWEIVREEGENLTAAGLKIRYISADRGLLRRDSWQGHVPRKAKGAFRAPFTLWVVQDDSASPRPSGRRRKRLRCLTAFDPNLLQRNSSHPETRPAGQRCRVVQNCSRQFCRIVEFGAKQKAPLGRLLHWWVVQDSNLRPID